MKEADNLKIFEQAKDASTVEEKKTKEVIRVIIAHLTIICK